MVLTNKQTGVVLGIVLGCFILSRALTLTVFPIFNDEAIYLKYSQAIHDDWAKNKFISMHGNWSDWKPPLQYWMAAPVIDCGRDPLVAGRGVSLLISVFGLLGFYFFTRELFGRGEALLAAILYTICPPVFFQNNQFTAETFLFSTAPFFYLALLKVMRSGEPNLLWAFLGVAAGTALLLFKQSGLLLIGVAVFLPVAQLRKEDTNWKKFALSCLWVVAVIGLVHFVARLILPVESDSIREHFNSWWVMSATELVRFPIDTWRANLGIVSAYVGAYYSWVILIFVGVFVWHVVRQRRWPDLALPLMGLAGVGAVILCLRGFNEYIFNTAIIVVLLPLLARSAFVIWDLVCSKNARWIGVGLFVAGGILIVQWGYQLLLMNSSPGRYIERSTGWAVTNYLKGWPTGFGIKEVVALLEKEKRAGVLFVDTQWGNPQVALEVYGRTRFPNFQTVPVSREFLVASETRELRERAKQAGEARWVVFSADPSGDRIQWQSNIEAEMCEERQEISVYPGQMPIVVCRF